MKKTKFKIYERIWDLKNEDTKELEKEGLEKGTYTYFGKASSKTYLSNRNSSWRSKYNKKNLPIKIQIFLERIQRVYKNKGLTNEEIDQLMFGTSRVIAYCENNKQLSILEKKYITNRDLVCGMLQGLIIEEPMILLNTMDSNVYRETDNGVTTTYIKPLETI